METGRPARNPLATLGLVLALVCTVCLALSGFGYRNQWWSLRAAFRILEWSAMGAALAGLIALAGIIAGVLRPERGRPLVAGTALVLSVAALIIPLGMMWRARHVPSIHDITTDTRNPPEFRAVLPLRAGAPNKAEYGGPEVAAQQLAAYPDLKPLLMPWPERPAFRKAVAAARDLGWDIVSADTAGGRLEATATTFWFGFKDDVVVRLVPQQGEDAVTLVDVRSVSRVGRSDVGTNARRIRAYLRKLAEE